MPHIPADSERTDLEDQCCDGIVGPLTLSLVFDLGSNSSFAKYHLEEQLCSRARFAVEAELELCSHPPPAFSAGLKAIEKG